MAKPLALNKTIRSEVARVLGTITTGDDYYTTIEAVHAKWAMPEEVKKYTAATFEVIGSDYEYEVVGSVDREATVHIALYTTGKASKPKEDVIDEVIADVEKAFCDKQWAAISAAIESAGGTRVMISPFTWDQIVTNDSRYKNIAIADGRFHIKYRYKFGNP